MDAIANTRASVDSNSPLLRKSQDTTASPTSSSPAEKGTTSNTSAKDAEAQKSNAKDTLNPKYPVSSIPFSMIHW
ncbi:hypothetical protein LEL_02301 [Akanthomyces lecanii RCEF 1005]|uniref:Uncharacterized protein n=1 Tax=Akanthomyces lecanii RCEF 1005 TaxID=1081108 RepID=A0A162IVS2_CORDF|nr:hypothetical protein LEL_02301 [Akanthomyces lecanii RCEF 1005]